MSDMLIRAWGRLGSTLTFPPARRRLRFRGGGFCACLDGALPPPDTVSNGSGWRDGHGALDQWDPEHTGFDMDQRERNSRIAPIKRKKRRGGVPSGFDCLPHKLASRASATPASVTPNWLRR